MSAGTPNRVTGSDAGNLLVIHGPTVQHEMQLWVQAGIPAKAALQAATYNAAKLLGVSDRVGLIRKGHEATLILVELTTDFLDSHNQPTVKRCMNF